MLETQRVCSNMAQYKYAFFGVYVCSIGLHGPFGIGVGSCALVEPQSGCAYECVFMCVYIYIYTRTCMCIESYMYMYTYAYICTCIYVYNCAQTHVCVCLCLPVSF